MLPDWLLFAALSAYLIFMSNLTYRLRLIAPHLSFLSADTDRETFKALPGMLADSLPDTYGRALLDRWLHDIPQHNDPHPGPKQRLQRKLKVRTSFFSHIVGHLKIIVYLCLLHAYWSVL